MGVAYSLCNYVTDTGSRWLDTAQCSREHIQNVDNSISMYKYFCRSIQSLNEQL